eukprot:3456048-Pleurochrysis_carterae.AAC.1
MSIFVCEAVHAPFALHHAATAQGGCSSMIILHNSAREPCPELLCAPPPFACARTSLALYPERSLLLLTSCPRCCCATERRTFAGSTAWPSTRSGQ